MVVHLHNFSDGSEALLVQIRIVDEIEEDLVYSSVGTYACDLNCVGKLYCTNLLQR